MMSLRDNFMAAAVILIVIVLLFIASCGGGGGGGNVLPSPEKPLSYDRHGIHVSPVELWKADGKYTFTYPGPADFDRIKAIGKWVVLNPCLAFLRTPEIGNKALIAIDLAHERGLLSIVRLDYNDAFRDSANPVKTDQAWFDGGWTDYVRQVVTYGKGKVWAYQVGNEVFEVDHTMIGPTGADITPVEYVDLVRRTAVLIRSIDPSVKIVNDGMVSPVEDEYYPVAVQLLEAGIEQYVDYFNWHYYTRGISSDDRGRIARLRALSKLPWIVTEANHIDPGATPERKWNIIRSVYATMAPEFICSFIWVGDNANRPEWTIKGTGLEALILQEWK